MRKVLVFLCILVSFCIVSPAFALFVNGGFETGDTTGWTVTGDRGVISSFTPQFNNTTGWSSGIPYYGDYSLLLGSPGVGNEWDDYQTSASTQIGTVTSDDLAAGLHLFFRWGAILEEPTNYVHPDEDQPYFSIEVSTRADSTVAWNSIYSEDQRANQTGFTKIGTETSGDAGDIWYGTDIADFDLSTIGLAVGHQVLVELFVQDCGAGGHGGLVFLDGFGTTNPGDPVPEPATMLLLGTGLAGLAGYGRRKRKKK